MLSTYLVFVLHYKSLLYIGTQICALEYTKVRVQASQRFLVVETLLTHSSQSHVSQALSACQKEYLLMPIVMVV